MQYCVQTFNTIVFLQRVACLLRKVVQEIERRISTQAEHIRNVSQDDWHDYSVYIETFLFMTSRLL